MASRKSFLHILACLLLVFILLAAGAGCCQCGGCCGNEDEEDDEEDEEEPEEAAAAAGTPGAADMSTSSDDDDDDDDDDSGSDDDTGSGDGNNAPTISGIEDVNMVEDGDPYLLNLGGKCTDVDGDTVSWSATGMDTSKVVVVMEAQKVTISPVQNAYGTSTIDFVCTDANGATATHQITVTIDGIDEAPIIGTTNPNLAGEVGTTYTTTIEVTDPDGDELTWSFIVRPSEMEISSSGTVSWIPVEAGTVDVEVKVCDPTDMCDSLAWTITITEGESIL